MMDKAIVGHMNTDEFEAMVETFIEHRSGEDDRLPARTFFERVAELYALTEEEIALVEGKIQAPGSVIRSGGVRLPRRKRPPAGSCGIDRNASGYVVESR